MSISKAERQTDTVLAFQLMLQHVGDRKISECFFVSTEPPFSAIQLTTWTELEAGDFVRPFLGSQHYSLTGRGWLRALEESGAPRDKTFLRAAEKLLTSIKKHVKGGQGSVRMVTLQTLAQNSGLPENWIYNVVESNLIEAHFNRHGPTWVHGFEGTAVHVPIRVGMEI
jgi:hypothetical protein